MLKKIEPQKFLSRGINIFLNRWFLLTSGDIKQHNTMTVSWGSLGGIWALPFVQVVVRPTRYTYEFMEKYNTFTLCSFPEQYKEALELLGSRSGKDGDKIKQSGLNITESSQIEAPSFAEADLRIECQKIYWQDMDPSHFLDPSIEKNYPKKDYHRIYYGKIMAISGSNKWTNGTSMK
ncbi:flavin reductase [Candidatus Auribacterota bacterium]